VDDETPATYDAVGALPPPRRPRAPLLLASIAVGMTYGALTRLFDRRRYFAGYSRRSSSITATRWSRFSLTIVKSGPGLRNSRPFSWPEAR